MKFPARKKRANMSAHMVATSPYGPRASTAVHEHADAHNGEATDAFIQKYSLRRRHKSEDLRLDNECDAEFVEPGSTNPSNSTNWISSSASLPLPAIILTPALPETGNLLPTRRRTVHSSSNGTQKKTANLPRSSTVTSLASFAALKSTKVVQKVKSVFRSRRSNEIFRPSKAGEQENDDDDAGADADAGQNDAQPEPDREGSKLLVPP